MMNIKVFFERKCLCGESRGEMFSPFKCKDDISESTDGNSFSFNEGSREGLGFKV